MNRIFGNWKIMTGIILVLVSASFYVLHYLVFRDAHHIFVFMLHDIAFVPLEVLFVTLIIERLLHDREKQAMLKKLNMLIGVFYSETGNGLMRLFQGFAVDGDELAVRLSVESQWKEKDFSGAEQFVNSHTLVTDSRKGDLAALREVLQANRHFLVGMLENPNVLEHESFSDLLWAVFHLLEELTARDSLHDLPDTDLEHISGDIKRAFSRMVGEWLAYMQHLKTDYPYLFSLAVRTNPFRQDASPLVQ